MTTIYPTSIVDLAERPDLIKPLVFLHQDRIPSLQSALGTAHLQLIYKNILEYNLGKVFIALRSDQVLAFACGLFDPFLLGRLTAKHTSKISLLREVLTKPLFFNLLWDHYRYRQDYLGDSCLYLASIARDTAPQATGLPFKTLNRLASETKKTILRSMVRKTNFQGLKFYQKAGFEIVKSYSQLHVIEKRIIPTTET